MAENIRLKVKGVAGFTTYHPETNTTQVLNSDGTNLDELLSDATVSKKGLVKLTDSVTSSDITTAATPKSVKAAYDLANGKAAKTLATTTADGLMSKADKIKINDMETVSGSQAKATKTLEDAKEYVNTTVSANAGSLEGMNWKNRMGAL